MSIPNLQSPVIVMGMAQCGTSLLAEMVHRGGTPMFAGDADPSYDTGIKYERRVGHRINRHILGVDPDGTNPRSIAPMWTWPMQTFPVHEINALRGEVGDGPWGIKDPRITLTYRVWLEAFPHGPRLYSYRGHTEYLRRSLRVQKRFDVRLARTHLRAWLAYNEAVVRNCAWDVQAKRPFAVVYYDELMENPDVIGWAEAASGVPLFDARDAAMRRTSPAALSLRERLFVIWAEAGYKARLRRVYAALDALRVRPPR